MVAQEWTGPERDFLERFYQEELVLNEKEKLLALQKRLGVENNAGGGYRATQAQMIACLEYELLINNGYCLECLR